MNVKLLICALLLSLGTLLSVAGCSSSSSTTSNDVSNRPKWNVHEPIIASWGADNLTVMKAAQKLNLRHLKTEQTGDTTKIVCKDDEWWYFSFALVKGRYTSVEVFRTGSYEYISGQYDLYVREADSVDSFNRLIVRTSLGDIAIEKGSYVEQESLLRFTNTAIEATR